MGASSLRVVLDTNVMLRGLISPTCAAAEILAAADDRQFITLLSRPVILEYREVLTDDALAQRFPRLTQKRVETRRISSRTMPTCWICRMGGMTQQNGFVNVCPS